jgi:hypothetical protein
MRPSTVLALQRSVGNRAVSRLLRGPGMQDEYEEEADRPFTMPMGIGQNSGLPAVQAPQPVMQDSASALADAAEEMTFMADERVRRRR